MTMPEAHKKKDFSLIETMLLENGNIFLLEEHLDRLVKSAEHFSFPAVRTMVERRIKEQAVSLPCQGKYRLRLLLHPSGKIDLSSSSIPRDNIPFEPVKITFSDKRTDRLDPFLCHKTTHRDLYDTELSIYREKGYFDVIFLNKEGEVTEGSITNVIVEKNGTFITPPLSSGVLPGTYRWHLLETGEIPLKEENITKYELMSADRVFIINSVIKMISAVLM